MSGAALDPPIVIQPQPAASWGAILAGTAVAVAATLSLMVLGAGLGLSMVSPWPSQSASVAQISLSAAIGLIVIQWLSSGMGGYVAGRLRTRWTDATSDEVFFRDTVHGFVVWCVGTIVVFVCVAMSAATTARFAAQATAAAASAPAAAMARQVADAPRSPDDYTIDLLFRASSQPAGATDADSRNEATRILANGLMEGDVPAADRDRLAQIVAARTGLAQAEAQTRVNEAIARARKAKENAQRQAEEARKAAQRMALLAYLSMAIGAFIASAAAALGGSHRDDNEEAQSVPAGV